MKLCPDAGATLEETRSSSEQVTGETVSYSVCEGPGSLLKFGGGCPLDQSLFRDTQLDPGDSALSLWSWPLQTQTCFYSEHIIHWFILWGFSLEVHMFVAGLLLCVWGSRFITEVLQRHTAGPWRLCSQSVVLTSANTNMFLFRTHHSLVHSLRIWSFTCLEQVSYFVCEGPGSLLKFMGLFMDRLLFRDTQLNPGDSALFSSSSS